MKKILIFVVAIFCCGLFFVPPRTPKHTKAYSNKPKLCIVIDDFGSYEQAGVETLLSLKDPITCAVIPNAENTQTNINQILQTKHEIILHMPMESHVPLPENWYGSIFIKTTDSPEEACKKIDECLNNFPKIKGFNIHIGSGVSQNENLMTAIYNHAKKRNLYFLDSRTIETKATENACALTHSVYLGRDVFLEPNKNRSYGGVCQKLMNATQIAQEKGYAIVIGHVGAEGGENTAQAIKNTLPKIKEMGIEIVSLQDIYKMLSSSK